MDKQTMLRFWELMGIERIDEDHMTLQGMEQTQEVEWLIGVAAEAKRRHHEWLRIEHPEKIRQAYEID